MQDLKHHKVNVNGTMLHYVSVGKGPVVVCIHGWPQNHREFYPVMNGLTDKYRFIAPDLRGFADSGKPITGYDPKTIAQDLIELVDHEGVDKFHILSHDLGGPPSAALAYAAGKRALSLAMVEAPIFGVDYPGAVDPTTAYWHLLMHMDIDITMALLEGREEIYLRHFFRDFAYNPDCIPEEDVQWYVMQMRQPGNLRAGLMHYHVIPESGEQLKELSKKKLSIPVLGLGGRVSFAEHCFEVAKVISDKPSGGIIEECGHWVFEEQNALIKEKLQELWNSV